MVKIVGIVVEYNPLHFGHVHHIEETRKKSNADVLIAVMSSHVVQRGEFSIVDKFKRTQWALNAGIDLVIELPGVFVLQSADLFAQTSVELLHHLGVEEIYFGSETGQVEELEMIALLMESKTYQDHLKKFLSEGKSYPSSSHLALSMVTDSEAYQKPNNILGIQYIKAIHHLKSKMKPCAIERVGSGYYDDFFEERKIQSATAIRKRHKTQGQIKSYVPSDVYLDLLSVKPIDLEHFYDYLQYRLASMNPKELKQIFGFEEGLENRFLQVEYFESIDDLIQQVISGRYTHAKIKRNIMHLLIGTKKSQLKVFNVPYIRVLGMNQNGQRYLSKIKHELTLPLITKIKGKRHYVLDMELRITKIYDLVYKRDLLKKEFEPVIIL